MLGSRFPLSTAAIFVACTSFANAALDKPIVVPPVPSMDQALLTHLVPAYATLNQWSDGYIPQDCKTLAINEKLSPNDIEAFDIFYEDCSSDPWVFCRHKDSPVSQKEMVEIFGRMPVKSRQFVRHIISIPGVISAGSSGDNIVLRGTGPNLMTVFIHETAHSMDSHAVTALPLPFHNTQQWLTAYNTDPAISDSYARTSQAENFAQTIVISIFDRVVPGGIPTIQPSFAQIQQQYTTAIFWLADLILPGGNCTRRLLNSEPVLKTNSAKFSLQAISPPDVGLSDEVEVIEPIPFGKIEFTSYA
ncbi:hypothetical protein DFH27DRAFT_517103 [Peziza echinospora]|nr:hypothetical protein DFH27DRAFT_517103 [Peziza echinospora]